MLYLVENFFFILLIFLKLSSQITLHLHLENAGVRLLAAVLQEPFAPCTPLTEGTKRPWQQTCISLDESVRI